MIFRNKLMKITGGHKQFLVTKQNGMFYDDFHMYENKDKIIKVLYNILDKNNFINIVTVCKPMIHMIEFLKPVIFVDPYTEHKINESQETIQSDVYYFRIRSEDIVNYVVNNRILKEKIKNKVYIFHIDFGNGGEFYLTREHVIEIMNNWLTDNGLITTTHNNFDIVYNLLFHPDEFHAYVNNNQIWCKCLSDVCDVYIPDYQDIHNNPFLFVDKYKNGKSIMTEPNKYYCNLNYVMYNAETYTNEIDKINFLKTWGLDNDKYNEILNVRMNPNCAETICFLCYYVLKKSNIIVGMSLDDYLQFSYVNDKDETIFLTYDEFKNRNSLNNIKQLLNNNELNNELNDELSDIINFFKYNAIKINAVDMNINKLLLMYTYYAFCCSDRTNYEEFIENCHEYIDAMDIPKENNINLIVESVIRFILSENDLDSLVNLFNELHKYGFRGQYFIEWISKFCRILNKSKETYNNIAMLKLKNIIESFELNYEMYMNSVFGITDVNNPDVQKYISEKYLFIIDHNDFVVKQIIIVPKKKLIA